MNDSTEQRTWLALRRYTQARIGLGRVGDSLPMQAVLEFGLAHAQARDAVHLALDAQELQRQLNAISIDSLAVRSAVSDRLQYLRRPDVGRRLSDDSRRILSARVLPAASELLIVVADGLSALAVMRHAVPLIRALQPLLAGESIAPIVIAQQARVALGDEIGELWRAEQVIMLIGERPGLSSADSLGVYLTYAPRVGRTDAERNCISNIRHEGLASPDAARRLAHLIRDARRLRVSGVALKDESDAPRLAKVAVDQGEDQSDRA
jgi:ethanolamine ammonia-lyase small subunit